MDVLSDFKLKMRDTIVAFQLASTIDKNCLSRSQSELHSAIRASEEHLKQRNELSAQLQDKEREVLSIARDGDARVNGVLDDKEQLQRKYEAIAGELSTAKSKLSALQQEYGKLRADTALAAADTAVANGLPPPSILSGATGTPGAARLAAANKCTQKTVEAFMEHVRGQMISTCAVAASTSEYTSLLSARLQELDKSCISAREAHVHLEAQCGTLCTMNKQLHAALQEARAAAASAQGAMSSLEAGKFAAESTCSALRASLADHAALVATMNKQLGSAMEAQLKHSSTLAQATDALKGQDATLQRLRGELLSLHEAKDRHDGILRGVRNEHAAELAAREEAGAKAASEFDALRADLAKLRSDAASATSAAESALASAQGECIAARQDCAQARLQVVMLENKVASISAAAAAAVPLSACTLAAKFQTDQPSPRQLEEVDEQEEIHAVKAQLTPVGPTSQPRQAHMSVLSAVDMPGTTHKAAGGKEEEEDEEEAAAVALLEAQAASLFAAFHASVHAGDKRKRGSDALAMDDEEERQDVDPDGTVRDSTYVNAA